MVDDRLLAAVIAAASALFVLFVRDVFGPLFAYVSGKREAKRQIIELYALPLATATTSLFFRLNEILIKKRAHFLSSDVPDTQYSRYKFISSLYRIAALFGWIQALKKERSLFLTRETEAEHSLFEAVVQIEGAFADGPHVEQEIVTRLCRLLGLQSATGAELEAIGFDFDIFTDRQFAKYTSRMDSIRVPDMPTEERHLAARNLVEFLAERTKSRVPSSQIIESRASEILEIALPKQSWVFRDWQSAIGEEMLVRAEGRDRMYDVIGFSAFEKRFNDGDPWIAKIHHLLFDLHPELHDESEYRVGQLIQVYNACAEILIRLSELKLSIKVVDEHTVEFARGALQKR